MTPQNSLQRFNRNAIVFFSLWAVVMVSGLGVIYSTHVSRQLFNELEGKRRTTAQLHTEWGQYLLEQSTWAAYNRIEDLAESKLDMQLPDQEKIIVVQAR
ncbi:MAG: cell division protein FtsL [Cellvibrionaceae bacterium]